MGAVRGAKEWQAWKDGKKLSRAQAVKAHCYICNGFEDSKIDCKGEKTCPLYAFRPYR